MGGDRVLDRLRFEHIPITQVVHDPNPEVVQEGLCIIS